MKKIHIGYHRTGTTFLQRLIFPLIENYKGRIYNEDSTNCNFDKFRTRTIYNSCKKVIEHFETEEDIFISWEIFSKISHKELFNLIGTNWNVLVVTRDFDSLIESRRRKLSVPKDDITAKIIAGNIDKEVREFYNIENLKKGLDNLTVLSYEKLFIENDKDEIQKLSDFLEFDILDIFLKNKYHKINTSFVESKVPQPIKE